MNPRPRRLGIVLTCTMAAIAALYSGLPAQTFHGPGTNSGQPRTLTFADRVAYQRAIEEVYWRHRIWPKERTDSKPSLDQVMTQAQVEKKVEDYLRNSQALEDYWQRPLTAEQLQAELDRMAQHTKQPEVLRELFEALGNDPFIIAECLARPALSERLVTNWYAYDQRFHGELKRRAEAELQAHPTVGELKQPLPAAASRSDAGAASGTYSEIELVKSDSAREEETHGGEGSSVKLNSHEWNENLQRLTAILGNAQNASSLQTAIWSPLQEDESGYYDDSNREIGRSVEARENRMAQRAVRVVEEQSRKAGGGDAGDGECELCRSPNTGEWRMH